MKQKTFLIIALLCTLLQGAWAWDGSGTSADPYLIKSSSDWKQLADNVRRGNSYSGTFFEMATDIDAMGISVGASDKPFSGTFSGGMYTLTYDRGEAHYGEGMLFVNDYCAPFILLDGATIRDLKVTGAVYSGNQFAAGIAVMIDGNAATTISSCYVSSELCASYDLGDDASFGGLVGTVPPLCTASPTIENCVFTGLLSGSCTRSAGMVGYAQSPVNFEHCMFDPVPYITAPECANFVRTKEGVECTFKECYYTLAIGTLQGEAVFRECQVPEGCSYRIVSEADAPFNGVDYYKSGAVIELTAPDDMPFNHWETNTGGCWISNPWQRSGRQTVRDIYRKPSFQIETSPTNPHEEREMDGIKYRYLNRGDYHYYISDETVEQKSYHFNERGELFKWDVNGNKAWVTAITGWVPGDIPSGGAVIYSDLKVVGRDHTLTATIAPCAFQGCQELRTLFFKDTGSNTSDASFPFDFTIGDRAFAYCGNLTEIKMMQYTTKGDNHWEALRSDQVSYVGDSIFFNSPHANFTVDAALYQIYLSSQVWRHVNNRILIYNHTDVDMKVNDALYCEMRNTAGESLKNTAEGHAQLMETLKYWNADYRQFASSSLLTNSSKNIWYTKVVGVHESSLDDGTMRIYNDPGSQYNYKTIALESLGQSKDVKKIEFWQTNGLSDNSYTDLKMVIRNGALKGCYNLEEIRLFYYVQDGDDHWETLGPKDVIPADDIFGIKNVEADELETAITAKLKVKFIVSSNRYQEFLDDPNWQAYQDQLVPQDGPETQKMDDFKKEGVTYAFMTTPGGIMQTSQTVSQDVSWLTIPRIMIEVALVAASLLDKGAESAARRSIEGTIEEITTAEQNIN